MKKKKVAFICVHNSCRSQIAEALGKHLAGDVFESFSAGTETKPYINQDAVRLMKEIYGIDMEADGQRSKLISEIPEVDMAISMGWKHLWRELKKIKKDGTQTYGVGAFFDARLTHSSRFLIL